MSLMGLHGSPPGSCDGLWDLALVRSLSQCCRVTGAHTLGLTVSVYWSPSELRSVRPTASFWASSSQFFS